MEAQPAAPGLSSALERYATALETFEAAEPQPSASQAVAVLVAHDALQAVLAEEGGEDATPHLVHLIDWDNTLKRYDERIATVVPLDAWRASLQPPPEAWWWYFEAPPQIDPWDRFDWIFQVLTLVALSLTAAFISGIYKAFTIGGLTIAQTFSTIAQGLGLVLIGSGALTEKGQEQIRRILRYLGIPQRFHSEAAFIFALLLMLIVWRVHTWLPGYYFEQGRVDYEHGLLTAAGDDFQRVLAIDPGHGQARIGLGDVYASLGSYDQALAEYRQGVEAHPYAFSEIGLIYIQRFDPVKKGADPVLAETYLRMANQRAEAQNLEGNTRFQIHRNLGWALLNQKRYEEAEQELLQAAVLDEAVTGRPFTTADANFSASLNAGTFPKGLQQAFAQAQIVFVPNMVKNQKQDEITVVVREPNQSWRVQGWVQRAEDQAPRRLAFLITNEQGTLTIAEDRNQIGGGMAYCFLAQLYTETGKTAKAGEQWRACLEHARPETVGEYKWFMDIGRPDLADCIDTSSVILGLRGQQPVDFLDACKTAGTGHASAQGENVGGARPGACGADGSVIDYEPQDAPAAAHVQATPLPALVQADDARDMAEFTQFQVVLTLAGWFQATSRR